MVLKTDKGLHAQKENYSILQILKQTKRIQEHMERPVYPLPGGSQSDTEDKSVIGYVLTLIIHCIHRIQEDSLPTPTPTCLSPQMPKRHLIHHPFWI